MDLLESNGATIHLVRTHELMLGALMGGKEMAVDKLTPSLNR